MTTERRKVKPNRPHSAAVAKVTPSLVEPMLPMLVNKTFSDSGWLFEPTWDGWRMLCFVRDGKAEVVSRKRNSLDQDGLATFDGTF